MSDMIGKLELEIINFKKWSSTLLDRQSDWELNYPYWNRIYSITDEIISSIPLIYWNEDTFQNILYLLARDNETETLLSELTTQPLKLIALAYYSLNYDDYQARWQIAEALGRLDAIYAEVDNIIVKFISDSNEYVSRRALLALAHRKSNMVEAHALEAWKSRSEHQRIAALYSLYEVNSPILKSLLTSAQYDSSKYVQEAAKSIKSTIENQLE